MSYYANVLSRMYYCGDVLAPADSEFRTWQAVTV